MTRRLIPALFLLLALAPALPAAEAGPIPAGESGVAWRASKRLLLFKHLDPAGVNRAATAEILPAAAKGAFSVHVEIPLAGFDSGSSTRDKDVFRALKGDSQPTLDFDSNTMDAKALAGLRDKGGRLEGGFKIGGQVFPLAFDVTGDGRTVQGRAVASLKALNVEAPSKLGGIMLKVSDSMELFFQFDVAKIKGAGQIK